MPLSIPVPVADFCDLIPLQSGSHFELDEAMNINRTGGGQVALSAAGNRLWRGSATFDVSLRGERNRAQSVLTKLRQPGVPFFWYDRKRAFPLADPDGIRLGNFTPQIAQVYNDDMRLIRLTGLPSAYELSASDLIGYSIGTVNPRFYVHELGEDVTAGAGGSTGQFELSPFRAPDLAVGTPVQLIRPTITAVYDPGSFNPGNGKSAGIEQGRTFNFVQTLEY